ncbi:DUF262 domain-containing protein (plasmid) [Hymenobacter volaticus]|uniref:DUF262 domain-containing protein n=2 Tax=Hymenobacter volaticus TaxID=2932254 RepID=A0ABY4GE18_9BACT|nr:DUF262 domain-containing protein [Hymenobacter volaticus]
MFVVRSFDGKNISWWHMEKDQIDFEPLYQRKGQLWSDRDKAFLIDSVINKFDIPKIYVADFTFGNSNGLDLNPSRKSYAIIDGKQRLEALFDFIDNKIALNNDFVYMDDPTVELGGLTYKDLKVKFPRIANNFDNFPLNVMSVITDQEGMINELFVRLNKSKPLTGSELRNAMEGLVPKLIQDISNHYFFKKNIKFNIARAQDLNTAAKLLLIEFRGKFVNIKKIDLDRFVSEAKEAESSNFDSAEKRVNSILALMHEAFEEKDLLLKTSGVIPVYYWLFKNHQNDYKILREFIFLFESARLEFIKIQKSQSKGLFLIDLPSENLEIIKNDTRLIDKKDSISRQLLYMVRVVNYEQYQNGLRNPNDQSGLVSAYTAIEKGFAFYIDQFVRGSSTSKPAKKK